MQLRRKKKINATTNGRPLGATNFNGGWMEIKIGGRRHKIQIMPKQAIV